MSVIDELKQYNLLEEFQSTVSEFVLKDKDKVLKLVTEKVNAAGSLRDGTVVKQLGALQRDGKLKPGLYKELDSINKKLEAARTAAPASTQSSGEVSTSQQTTPQETVSMSEQTPETTSTEATIITPEGFSLTEKENEKLKARMAKEEQKSRERLAKYAQKQVERLKARAEKSAQKKGMKLEEMQEIKERKEKIAVLKEEIKERNELRKKLKEEINALRPKRAKKVKEEAGENAAEKKTA